MGRLTHPIKVVRLERCVMIAGLHQNNAACFAPKMSSLSINICAERHTSTADLGRPPKQCELPIRRYVPKAFEYANLKPDTHSDPECKLPK